MLFGAFFLVGLYLTWKRIRVSEETQLTERFTQAVTQLGDEKLEVRLGGIYALERIARDSAKDHWTIMEVLTAYVRENAPWPPKEVPKQPEGEASQTEGNAQREKQEEKILKPPTDIQAILTVLRRRARFKEEKEDQRLDLGETNLAGAYLGRANLETAYLGGANLETAYLGGANLETAYLREANLEGARLWGANLRGADLGEARGFTQEQIDQALTSEEAKLPKYLSKTEPVENLKEGE